MVNESLARGVRTRKLIREAERFLLSMCTKLNFFFLSAPETLRSASSGWVSSLVRFFVVLLVLYCRPCFETAQWNDLGLVYRRFSLSVDGGSGRVSP